MTSHSATLIDNIFSNNHLLLSGIIYSNISDHLPIFAIFETSAKIENDANSYCHATFKPANLNCLKHDLCNTSWPNVNSFDNVNEAYNNFILTIRTKINIHLSKCSLNQNKSNYMQPWMTSGILKSCHIKNKLYKKYMSGHIAKSEYIVLIKIL
jgi:hypothetical protein